jgi:hypothetical protein
VAAALMSDEHLGRIETELAALSSKLDNLRTVLAQVFRRSLRLAGGRASTLYCSFCGKSQHEVAKLIAGPSLFICNECTDLCYGIVHKDEPP